MLAGGGELVDRDLVVVGGDATVVVVGGIVVVGEQRIGQVWVVLVD